MRLLSDLPKLDEDLRKAGTGGMESRIDFTSSMSVIHFLIIYVLQPSKQNMSCVSKQRAMKKLEMHTNRIKYALLIFRRSNRWMDFTLNMILECVSILSCISSEDMRVSISSMKSVRLSTQQLRVLWSLSDDKAGMD